MLNSTIFWENFNLENNLVIKQGSRYTNKQLHLTEVELQELNYDKKDLCPWTIDEKEKMNLRPKNITRALHTIGR